MIVAIIMSVALASLISLIWVNLITKAHEECSDYKGEDFLDWGDEENKNHTEGDF